MLILSICCCFCLCLSTLHVASFVSGRCLLNNQPAHANLRPDPGTANFSLSPTYPPLACGVCVSVCVCVLTRGSREMANFLCKLNVCAWRACVLFALRQSVILNSPPASWSPHSPLLSTVHETATCCLRCLCWLPPVAAGRRQRQRLRWRVLGAVLAAREARIKRKSESCNNDYWIPARG